MAAVTTKKPGGDVAIELTFPAVYQELYADAGEAERFAPSFPLVSPPFVEGEDIQAAYHEQKRKDAHHMARAAVDSRQFADARMLSSHANYYQMPRPVLSQRVYANPSLGNLSGAIDSARRTMDESMAPFRCLSRQERGLSTGGCGACYDSLRGGVIRTLKGQEWAANRLQDRIKQLDEIDAAKEQQAIDTGVGIRYPSLPEGEDEFALKSQIDLVGALAQINNSLMSGNLSTMARFALEDISKAVKLLARWSVTAEREDYREAIELLDNMVEGVLEVANDEQAQMAAPGNVDERRDKVVVMEGVLPRVAAMRDYVREMYDAVGMSMKDKKARSAALLRSTGLTSFKPKKDYNAIVRDNIRLEGLPQPAGVLPDFDAPAGFPGGGRGDDDEGGGGRPARFDGDGHDALARRQGAFIGEAEPGGGAAGANQIPGINPQARQLGNNGLQPLAEAAAPVFREQPARQRVALPAEMAAAEAAAAQEQARLEAAVAPAGEAAVAAAQPAAAIAPKRRLDVNQFREDKDIMGFLTDKEYGAPAVAPQIMAALADVDLVDLAASVPSYRQPSPEKQLQSAIERIAQYYRYLKNGKEDDILYVRNTATANKGDVRKEGSKFTIENYRAMVNLLLQKYGLTELKGRGRMAGRGALPKTREGYKSLAADLKKEGRNIRVNSGSQLKSIRSNFIKKLGL